MVRVVVFGIVIGTQNRRHNSRLIEAGLVQSRSVVERLLVEALLMGSEVSRRRLKALFVLQVIK